VLLSAAPALVHFLEGQPSPTAAGSLRQTELPVDWFDQRHGLASGQVHQTAIDQTGRLWAATPCGLARYDGSKMHMFSCKDGLRCAGLRTISFDASGRIWLGSDAGLDIYIIDGDCVTLIESMLIGTVDCIAVNGDEAWIGTPAGLLYWEKSAGFQPVAPKQLQSAIISACLLSPAGTLWVAGPQFGIARLSGGIWLFAAREEWRDCGCPFTLANGPDEYVLFAGDQGLGMMAPEGKLHGSAITNIPVSTLHFADGAIWAGAGETLLRFQPTFGTLTPLDQVHEGTRFKHATTDSFGNIWFSSDNKGIARVSCLRRLLASPQVEDIGSVLCVRPSGDGHFIGGSNGVISPDGEMLLRGVKVWDIDRDHNGIVWAASENGLICLANPTLGIPFSHKSPVLSSPCRVLHRSDTGLYVGSIRGLVRVASNGNREFLTPEGRSLGYVYSLFEDRDGVLWIATLGNGLWRMFDDEIEKILGGALHESANVMSVCQSANGDIFVAHNERISRIDRDGLVAPFYESPDAVSGWAIGCFAEGMLFAGTSSGLKVIDLATGSLVRTIASAPFNEGWEFTTSRSMILTSNGKLLCGTSKGLRSIDLTELERLAQTPDVKLARVKWIGVEPTEFEECPKVSPGKWRVGFDVWTDWAIDEMVCTMQYRLLGFESEWSVPQPMSTINFTSLPAGHYALEVRLSSPLCGTGEGSLLYRFWVGEAWHSLGATLLDRARTKFGSGSALGSVTGWARLRKRHQLEQLIGERMTELTGVNEQLRIAQKQLELLAYTDPLTGIPNRRAFDAALSSNLDRSRISGLPVSLILIDLDHFKQYNDTYGHGLGDMCLKRVAAVMKSEIRKPNDLAARIGGEEFVILLPETSPSEAACVAERLLNSICALQIPHATSSVAAHVTASLGVVTAQGGTPVQPAQLLAYADEQLYRAKAHGKNRWYSKVVGSSRGDLTSQNRRSS
jgi:diguanylate cyclase (GGDEF)-like protein